MDERNIPQTDAELDKILPTQGYEVSRHSILSSQFLPLISWFWSNHFLLPV